jgi:uncharacterized membrane protein
VKQEAFLGAIDDARIVSAIRAAESRSRGEIRVHVAEGQVEDARRAAEADFARLGMAATAERNGVLILVAPESQTLAVIGDRAIHERCPPGFWDEVAAAVAAEFRGARFTDGIVIAVTRVGDELARHFPRRPGEEDRNELPDGVSRDAAARGKIRGEDGRS